MCRLIHEVIHTYVAVLTVHLTSSSWYSCSTGTWSRHNTMSLGQWRGSRTFSSTCCRVVDAAAMPSITGSSNSKRCWMWEKNPLAPGPGPGTVDGTGRAFIGFWWLEGYSLDSMFARRQLEKSSIGVGRSSGDNTRAFPRQSRHSLRLPALLTYDQCTSRLRYNSVCACRVVADVSLWRIQQVYISSTTTKYGKN